MHSVIYLAFAVMFLNKNKCSYIINKRKTDQISNNIEMLVKPMKVIAGIFPKHEFEVQFNLEHVDYERPSQQIKYKNASHPIMRSKDIPKATSTVTVEESAPVSYETTPDDNPIVHMKDLKKALKEFEKKYSTGFIGSNRSLNLSNVLSILRGNCINKELTTKSTNTLSSFHDNLALSDVLQLIKRGAKLQHDIPNTDDSDLSWLKIKIPTA